MIKCCQFCVAPKRHLGCHSDCPEYIEEKAQWEEERARIAQQNQLQADAYPKHPNYKRRIKEL